MEQLSIESAIAAGEEALQACVEKAKALGFSTETARGYDIHSLRRLESETEHKLRVAQERIAQMEHEREVERRLFRDLRVAA